MVAYFKAAAPRQKRWLSNGSHVQFSPVTTELGVFSTDNEFVIKELNLMIAESRGGVFAIDEREYETLKKNRISGRPWREELGKRGLEVNQRPVQHQPNPQAMAAATAAEAAPAAAANPEPERPRGASPVPEGFRPTARKKPAA